MWHSKTKCELWFFIPCNAMNTAPENTVMNLVRHLVTYSSGINQCCNQKTGEFTATEAGDPCFSLGGAIITFH